MNDFPPTIIQSFTPGDWATLEQNWSPQMIELYLKKKKKTEVTPHLQRITQFTVSERITKISVTYLNLLADLY